MSLAIMTQLLKKLGGHHIQNEFFLHIGRNGACLNHKGGQWKQGVAIMVDETKKKSRSLSC